MEAANIEGVEFKSGKVRQSEQLNHEQIENNLLLGDIQKHASSPAVSAVGTVMPLISAIGLTFMRTVQAVYMYRVPSVDWFDVFYNVTSLLTLTSYPFILSITPFTERPADVAGLLRNPRMVDAFI